MQTNLPASMSGPGPSTLGSAGFNINSLFTSWGATIAVVVLLVIVFAVYYQTIGYYFNLGWERLSWSKAHHEKVEVSTPDGGPSALLTPAPSSSLGKAMDKLESDVESALGSGFSVTGSGSGGKPQVFNVARNLFKFSEAEPLCRAYGAELATYDQVKEAYKAGADWCNYGWVKGQLALYPTQKSTYEKLQTGPESERMMCGLPGVNGGFFPNEDQRFGVNCYGPRPVETALDQREHIAETTDIPFDREVNRFRSELNSFPVSPFNSDSWSA